MTTIVTAENDPVNPPANHPDDDGKWSSLHGYVVDHSYVSKEAETYTRASTQELTGRMAKSIVSLLLKMYVFFGF
jgi:hypothetical protein